MNYKFAQLIQNPGKKSKTLTEVYIAQPDSHKENLAGKLFVLSEISRNDSIGIKLINFLTDSIVQNFYQNEKLLLRERMPSLKVEHIFEASLAKTNHQLSEFIKKERFKFTKDSLSITTGVIFKNELYVANHGKNKVYMIFPSPADKDKEAEYQIANIVKSEDSSESKNHRLFSDVISGKIPNRASIFLSNEALPEYVSQKKLLNILSSLPPTSAMEQIKNTINSINTYVAFAGIIIKNTTLEQNISKNQSTSKLNSSGSIENLNKTEETAEALLTPSGLINFKKWIKLLSPSTYLKLKASQRPNLALKDKIFVKKNSSLRKIFRQIQRFITNISQALLHIFKGLSFGSFTINLKERTPKLKNLISFPSTILPTLRSLISNKKFILGLALFFIVLLFLNINKTEKGKQVELEVKKYDEITDSIEKKQNQAEASLLYSNDEGAKRLFEEINELLEELPQDTEEQQQKYLDYKEKYDEQLEKIRRITRTESANIITDYSEQSSRAEITSIKLISNINKLYASDPGQRTIYIHDLFENVVTSITDLENPITSLKSPVAIKNSEEESVIYYFNESNLITLNTISEELSTTNIQLNSLQNDIPAGIYNSNIYVADKQNNEIYKHNKSGDFFSTGEAWLRTDLDLSKTVSIAIDGNIYVLNSDGTVIKLLRGEIVDFDLEQSDPPLESATKLKISEELDFLYVLDPSLNRLLVYDKEGQFLMQYQGDNLQNLKDFEIDEEQKIIYFLTGTVIQKFNAVHFE